jgi:hypothetical protein
MISFSFLSKRRGATAVGVFSLAFVCMLLLCGAGSVPVENFLPQGSMQGDLNAGGHNLTNAGTVSATNVVVSGSLTAPASFTLPFSQLTGTPTDSAAGYAASTFAAYDRYPGSVNMIIDEDYTGDPDDALAVTTAIALMQRGECNILGFVTDTYNTAPAPAISAILHYCGYGAVPVGAFQSATTPADSAQTWATSVLTAWPTLSTIAGNNGITGASSSIVVGRTLLAHAPNKSLIYFISGSWSTLAYLINSAADSISPLTGSQLFSAKVKEVFVMGSNQTTGTEHNLSEDPTSTASGHTAILAMTPTIPIYWFPLQMGSVFVNGPSTYSVVNSPNYLSDDSPADYYDNFALYLAVRGLSYNGNTYATATQGAQAINSSSGANTFTAGAGDDYMLSFATGGQTQMIADETTLLKQSNASGTPPAAFGVVAGTSLNVSNTGTFGTIKGQSASLVVGTNNSGGTTTPTVISFDSSYGTNTPGAAGNEKISLYGGVSPYGIGLSNNLLEFDTGSAFSWFSSGTLDMNLTSSGNLTLPGLLSVGGAGGSDSILATISGTSSSALLHGFQAGLATGNSVVMRWGQSLTSFACGELYFDYTGSNATENVTLGVRSGNPLGVDSSGKVLISSTQTTVSGSTSGTAVFSEPFAGSSYKKAVIYCSSLVGTAGYTFPTAFTNTPVVVTTSGPAASVVTSLSTTAITVTGSTTSGPLIVEGY